MPDRFPEDAFFEALASGTTPGKEVTAPDSLKDRIFSALTGGIVEQDQFFEGLAGTESQLLPAPSRLKSKIYSALVLAQSETGPLLSLPECKEAGQALCVFEELVRIAPVGRTMQSINYCRVCHARVLGERVEGAPIYWPGCPYVSFQNR